MLPRLKVLLACVALLALAAGEETPPGLVAKDNGHDLQAEATQTGQTQKREAGGLHDSYGAPLPPDAYGPPLELGHISHVSDLHHPAPVYEVPEFQSVSFEDPPPGAYGPPSPVFPSQTYEGPPPPVFKPKPSYGPPKHYHPKPHYGPPKISYGPPKLTYGPPKKIYGPPKQSLPKPTYGVPFKPPKIISKPVYGPPKPLYGPPKPVYGPPKITYGTPNLQVQNIHVQELPAVTVSHQSFSGLSNLNSVHSGINIDSNIEDLGFNLPAPIYGTPLVSLPQDLKPNFPLPTDTYGPPGQILGPVGHSEQVVVEGVSHVEHYGPPQPDPNPRPPHPGIPAPPTPPHVLYDGWKPIPGLAIQIGHVENVGDQYGPPPPPPVVEEIHFEQNLPHLEHHQFFSVEGQNAPSVNQHQHFSNAQITTGYSSVHQEALADVHHGSTGSAHQGVLGNAHQSSIANIHHDSNVHHDALSNIDINAIVGGDSNHIDQAKTVFEAHYTENHLPSHHFDVSFVQPPVKQLPILDSYGAPPLDSYSASGPYPAAITTTTTIRQHGAKGLIPPSGIYGVPPGGTYGAPPKPPPAHLPIPYGSVSGGHHSGGHAPRQPIKFREPVPQGLLEHVGKTTHGKDHHGIDHLTHGPSYLPPPIRDLKEHGGEELTSVSYSIEPSNLYSLPHAGNPLNFQGPPSNLYGSPIDSYSVPLLTVGVGDHAVSGSSTNSVTSTIDGTLLANLSNLDAAAILKHCPYHEAILKAAQSGEKIPADLASKYIASLNSLGKTLGKNPFNSHINSFEFPLQDLPKDLITSPQTIVPTALPSDSKQDKNKSKSLRQVSKSNFKDEKLQFVSDQILKTSEKIKSLSEETKKLQQKIVSSSQNLNQVNAQLGQNDLNKGKTSYSFQIQSSNGKGNPTIPHEQLLSEGLLQSILSAIEQPNGQTNNGRPQNGQNFQQNVQTVHSVYTQNGNAQFSQNGNAAQFAQNGQGNVQFAQNAQSNVQFAQNAHSNEQFAQNAHSNEQFAQNAHSTAQFIRNGVQLPPQNSQFQQNFTYPQINVQNFAEGIALPEGYEPVDRTKEKKDQEVQSTNKEQKIVRNENHRGDIPDCDLKVDHSVQHPVVVPPPNLETVKPVEEIDENDVAIFFDQKEERADPVTEISVATSISEDLEEYSEKKFGEKVKKN